jgi:hypothetical protein
MTTTTEDILVSAMQKIGALDVSRTALESDETPVILREYNQILSMLSLRTRNSYFIRQESWAFAVARDSYTIGMSSDSPNFAVSSGPRPNEILEAKIVLTSSTPNIELDCAIWTFQQYKNQVNIPTLASSFPRGIYYKPTMPNGTIFPYPANPVLTSYKLQLSWADAMIEVALADLATEVRFAPGQERFLTLELAMALTLLFPVRTNLEELKRQYRAAKMEFQAKNDAAPIISTTDGMSSGNASGWNWISRRFS